MTAEVQQYPNGACDLDLDRENNLTVQMARNAIGAVAFRMAPPLGGLLVVNLVELPDIN